MATKYALFFGILLTAVCGIVGTGNRSLTPFQRVFTGSPSNWTSVGNVGLRQAQTDISHDDVRRERQEVTTPLSGKNVAYKDFGIPQKKSLQDPLEPKCFSDAVMDYRLFLKEFMSSLRSVLGTFAKTKLRSNLCRKLPCPSGIEDKRNTPIFWSIRVETHDYASLRNYIIRIASAELGVQEATGNNDGKRVEEYLAYTGLGKGHAWCAAFVSWCYGQAGLAQPRNPWSPALFPNARTYWKSGIQLSNGQRQNRVQAESRDAHINPADVFGIYGNSAKRINHVGLVKEQQGNYLITIEGNSNDRVESRRRHLSTIYALADWIQ